MFKFSPFGYYTEENSVNLSGLVFSRGKKKQLLSPVTHTI